MTMTATLLSLVLYVYALSPVMDLPSTAPISQYDAVFIGDTLYVVTFSSLGRSVSVMKIAGDTVRDVYEPEGVTTERTDYTEGFRVSRDGRMLLTSSLSIQLHDWLGSEGEYAPPLETPLLPIRERGYRFGYEIKDQRLLPGNDVSYLLYTDCCGYTKFTFAIDNMNRQYSKNFIVPIRNGKADEPIMIQPGRTSGYTIRGMLSGDTLLAVWQECEKKARTIVLSAFDGDKWKKRSVVATDSEDPMMNYGTVMEISKLGKRLYIFWYDWISPPKVADTIKIYYKWTEDRTHWSAREACPLSFHAWTMEKHWSSVTTPDGRMHILARMNGSRDDDSYIVFDGTTWENRGIISQGDVRHEKIVADNQGRVYALWLLTADGASDEGQIERVKLDDGQEAVVIKPVMSGSGSMLQIRRLQ